METAAAERSAAPAAAAAQAPRGLWEGRAAVLVGLVLLGIGLRHAVTLLSPLLGDIREALGLGTAGATFLGMLPTLSFFGTAGLLAPVLARKVGAEAIALLAAALAAAGTLLRPFTDSAALFMVLTTVALVGMGFGNVVGAPLVKKYFPDRQAAMVTVFALLMQAGATLPAMTSIPVANALGWQASLASWGLLSLVTVVPWVIHLLKSGCIAQASGEAAPVAAKLGLAQLVTRPVAAGTALFYAMASLNIYAMLAWLPTIMQQHLGLDRDAAGAAFSVYTFMTLPMAFVTPLIANKMKNPMPLAALLVAAGPAGYVGMILGIGPPWLLALVAGLAGGAFPLAIAMFNLRTRTPIGSATLAGFAMGIGYLAGTLGPLLGGWLYAATGGWTTPLWVYVATLAPMTIGGLMMARPGCYLEGKLSA